MKKFLMMMAAVVAAFTFNSCSSDVEDIVDNGANSLKDVKIVVNVADLESNGTRAAKTSWVAGDKINLWFNSWNPGTDDHTPQLVLTYNGTNWTAGALADGAVLTDGQYVLAVYEGYNDLTKYTYQWYQSREWFYSTHGYGKFNDDSYASPMVVYGTTQYTYVGETLTLNLNIWHFETRFKVLVKNMPTGTASNFELVTKNVTTDAFAQAKGAWIVIPSASITLGNGSSNYEGIARGVQEDDGVAFYYTSFSASDAEIKFTLWDGTTKKSYTVNNKTVTCPNSKCVGVALNYSSFVAE